MTSPVMTRVEVYQLLSERMCRCVDCIADFAKAVAEMQHERTMAAVRSKIEALDADDVSAGVRDVLAAVGG